MPLGYQILLNPSRGYKITDVPHFSVVNGQKKDREILLWRPVEDSDRGMHVRSVQSESELRATNPRPFGTY
jgi:hypothetical protein